MTSFPPSRYVQITRTILTILTFRVRFIDFSQLTNLSPFPPFRFHFVLPRTTLGLFTIQVPVTFAYCTPSFPPPKPSSNLRQLTRHAVPTQYSPPLCARRLLLSSAAPHHPLRRHHGNRATSASYFARRHIGPTNMHSIRYIYALTVNMFELFPTFRCTTRHTAHYFPAIVRPQCRRLIRGFPNLARNTTPS